jgi:exopolyphosphatase/guanosine-5'-triphosphate,3'-diphosphate pyrophosphatase
MVKQSTSIAVEVISGEREADLIAKGVLAALPDMDTPILIMDIGGGSVEMILMHHDKVLFRSSSPVGVAVLYEQFHHEEPISKISIERLNRHLETTFAELLARLESLHDTVLVGASGTFEVVESILVPHKEEDARPYSTAESDDFIPIYNAITGMDLAARLVHPAIPESRAKYIVVAVHLIQFILTRLGSNIFYTSTYAMKEGIIVEKSMGIKE